MFLVVGEIYFLTSSQLTDCTRVIYEYSLSMYVGGGVSKFSFLSFHKLSYVGLKLKQ